MSAEFSRDEFVALLDDIETYLGYLKGNELAWRYLQDVALEVDAAAGASGDSYVRAQGFYETPCPASQFKVEFTVTAPKSPYGPGVDLDIADKIVAGANQSWHNGAKWAAGVADQAVAITDQVTRPDTKALLEATWEMHLGVTVVLEAIAAYDDWGLGDLPELWTGRASEEFNDFREHYTQMLLVYGQFSAYATTDLSTAGLVIAEAQRGLQGFARGLRDNTKRQLEAWTAHRQPPTDAHPLPTWLTDLVGLRKYIKAARLPFKIFLDPDNALAHLKELGGVVAGIGHGASGHDKEAPFEAADSEEILRMLTDTMRQVYLEDFRATLSDLSTGHEMRESLSAMHRRDSWLPEPVPATGSLVGPGDRYPGS